MTTATAIPRPTPRLVALRRRHGWLAVLILLFGALLIVRASQVPNFGGFELRTIIAGSMTLAFLAMAQSVVIIAGGLNMSVGALMVFANCLSAAWMEGADVGTSIGIALIVILICVVISAVTGVIVAISGVPDIVVTLAVSFILSGAALMVMPAPGGGIPAELQPFIVGGFSDPIPALMWIAGITVVLWLPFRRSRSGLAIYAIGSSKDGAYLSGVNVAATKVLSYALSGLFIGLAGVAATAFTGGGEPRTSIGLAALLASVAAVVLGGVGLTGGTGGLIGPILAAFVLSLIPAIMLGFGWDPNFAQVANGATLILVVLLGGFIQVRRRNS